MAWMALPASLHLWFFLHVTLQTKGELASKNMVCSATIDQDDRKEEECWRDVVNTSSGAVCLHSYLADACPKQLTAIHTYIHVLTSTSGAIWGSVLHAYQELNQWPSYNKTLAVPPEPQPPAVSKNHNFSDWKIRVILLQSELFLLLVWNHVGSKNAVYCRTILVISCVEILWCVMSSKHVGISNLGCCFVFFSGSPSCRSCSFSPA